MVKKSTLDIAYEYVQSRKNEVPFSEIWNHIIETLSLSEADANGKVAKFYTNLMFDGRFVDLGDNIWDLRSRHPFDKVHIDLNDVYNDVDDGDDESDDDEEEIIVKKPKSEEEDDEEEEKDEDDNSEDENNGGRRINKSLY